MAIQGIFLADFTQYNAAVDGADAKLRKFTSTTDKNDAAAKRFSSSTTQTANTFSQLSTGLGVADKTLGAFGVHIGPQIHALEELATASGKTAAQIGLIGTVSLVAAAALGGWEIGKLIRSFTDADEAVSHWIDSTFNLAVAQEEAGAKQDVLDRATQNAGHTITDYTEAVHINTKAEKDRIVALKEREKAEKEASDSQAAALEKERAATAAYAQHLTDIQDQLLGNVQIAKAQDYMRTFVDVKNVTNLNSEALEEFNNVLSAGFSRLVEQGGAATEMAAQMNTWRLAVIAAQETHTAATTQMESDEERLARESAELAKAMKDNFVIIGHSAEEAAGKMDEFGDAAEEAGQRAADAADAYQMSWSDAMDAVRAGQGTMGGVLSGTIPVGAEGSTTRYDDYGNPYGYIPGVNLPGHTAPPTGGSGGSFVFNISDSFFETPADHQRLADRVRTALGTQAMSRGA